jgi:hypothetical protein
MKKYKADTDLLEELLEPRKVNTVSEVVRLLALIIP